MKSATASTARLGNHSKRLAKRVLAIGSNRIELLLVELQEERNRILRALVLTVGAAAFGFLAGVTLTIVVVVLLWNHSPIGALLVLTGIYAGIAAVLVGRLTVLRRDWKTLPATFDQIRKDRECLEKCLK